MKEIRLYIYTNAPVRSSDRAKYSYLMQYVKDGQVTGQREDHAAVDENQKGATLEALIASVTRINDGNDIPVTVICHCPGVIQAINQSQIATWSLNGWQNSKGKEVEHAGKWQRVKALMDAKTHDITARPPADSETELMHKLGAEGFDPHLNIA